LLDRRPAQLSGGQRQRVAMGRALVRKPRIFLFDEPLSNLDAQLRVDMRTEIKKLHQRLGATIVYVTHDQIEAMTLATRIAVMRAGELLQLGSPAEIYNRPANTFVAGFMGSPRMNLIPGTLKSEGSGLHLEVAADGAAPARIILSRVPDATRPYIGREITAGLRPEAISDKLDAGGSDGRPVIEATVEVTEPTGPDTLAVLELVNGKILSHDIPDALGDPENPLTTEQVCGKARMLLASANYSPAATEGVISAALALAEDGAVTNLAKQLT
jgi:multiple sugar transport system ATP-binding protein